MTSNAIDYARTVSQAKLNETQMDVNRANVNKLKMEERKIGSDIGSSWLKSIGDVFKGISSFLPMFL